MSIERSFAIGLINLIMLHCTKFIKLYVLFILFWLLKRKFLFSQQYRHASNILQCYSQMLLHFMKLLIHWYNWAYECEACQQNLDVFKLSFSEYVCLLSQQAPSPRTLQHYQTPPNIAYMSAIITFTLYFYIS